MPGEGTVFPRDRVGPDGKTYRRWVAQISLGPREARRRVTRVCSTRTEARAALAELLENERSGTRPSSLALGIYLRSWLAETVTPSVRPNTLRGYEDAIAHLDPIAHVALDELTAEQIERTLNRMTARRRGQKEATPASPKTRRNVLVMLRAALGDALQRRQVRHNVAKEVAMVRVERPHREALTPEGAKAILAAVKGDRYEAAYALGLLGLRASEILGLAWADVADDCTSLQVRYQLVGSGENATRALPKTRSSARTVPVPPPIAKVLREHRTRQREERIAAGQATEEGLVFLTERGLPVNGSMLTKRFQRLLEAAGLPDMRLHDLRHGAATLLAGLGVHPAVAQAVLGHASSRTTQDIYTHVTADQQREAVDRLAAAVIGAGQTTRR